MAWSGQTVAAVAGPRLSEGLGRTRAQRNCSLRGGDLGLTDSAAAPTA